MATKTKYVDWGGLTPIVNGIRVNATKPGQTGTELTATEALYLDALTAGTVSASKAVVVDSSKAIAGFTNIEIDGPVGTGATGAGLLELFTNELTVALGTADQLGRIDFAAPLESSGTDAILVAASIWAEAAADFTSTSNQTDLVFACGVSEAAAEVARISSAGTLTCDGNVTPTGNVLPTGYVSPTAGYRAAPVACGDVTSYTVLATDSGKVHIMSDVASSCTYSLPTAAAGLNYEFWYGGAAADAHNHIIDSTGFFIGGVMFADHDAADAEIAPVTSNNSSNDIFTMVKPTSGTVVKMVCNGTNWYISGYVVSDTIPTFGD